MKRLTFAAALILACITSASALAGDNRCQIGIVGGLTSSATTINGAIVDIQTNNLNQFHAGVGFKIPLGNFFALQPQLLYDVKGSIVKFEDLASLDFKTGFIELPVQVQWAPFGYILNIVRPYVIAEPFIGYAVSNEYKTFTGNIEYDWSNMKTRFEYGIGLGIGVGLFKHVQITARYCWNLGNLYDASISWEQFKYTISSSCSGIQVSAGIFF